MTGLTLYAVASLAGGLATGPGLATGRAGGSRSRRSAGLPQHTGDHQHHLRGGPRPQPRVGRLGRFRRGRPGRSACCSAASSPVAFGWEAVFFVNVPLAGAALILRRPVLIHADRPRDNGRVFDLPGALAATGAVTLFVFALVQGRSSAGIHPGSLAARSPGYCCWGIRRRRAA